MKPVILYHANCNDGFGAAWAVWRKLGDSAEYRPVQYGEEPPSFDEEVSIYILDFSYPRKKIEELKARSGSVVVIEHHKSAAKELEGLDYVVFAQDKSAAVLAWEYFHPGEPAPELLRYVQDRDLWRFELPKSREVSAALESYPMDFTIWSQLDLAKLMEEGGPILRFRRQAVKMICDQASLRRMAGHVVPVVNASAFGSDVCDELLRRFPDHPFAACYYDRGDGQRQWSLRSRSQFDVSEIAGRFGGGGHRQAAGFETTPRADCFEPPLEP